MKSPEDRLIRAIDTKRSEPPRSEITAEFKKTLPELRRKAEAVIADCQIQESSFEDLYGNEKVARDLRYIQETKRKFAPEDETWQCARILEAMLLEHVELSDWFGENATTIKTAEFDDIAHGVDMIVRYEPTTENLSAQLLALGVDVTFSPKGTEAKLERIFHNLYNGHLGQIKYFSSEVDGYRGERTNVPLVVLGMEVTSLEKIGALWAKKDNKALANHPVQHMLLAQADTQLSAMYEMAKKRGNEKTVRGILGPQKIIHDELTKRGPVALPPDRVWDAMQKSIHRMR